MSGFDRRAFLGIAVGAVSMLRPPLSASAQSCAPAGVGGFLPQYLTVDCASRRNFQIFRKNSDYLGLSGVVSMSSVRGKYGSYDAGSMFLFPWLKPKGNSRHASGTVLPISSHNVKFMSSGPIPDATLPLDEYFCNYRLQAPPKMFIGFQVDVPHSKLEARFDWFTNTAKLADGKGVGIDWTSSNLNHPWFGGSRFIPNKDSCNGAAWRKRIEAGLMEASRARCAGDA